MRRCALVLAALARCNDPVHDAEVAALGPEDPAVPQGPTHRPGQPCLVCHDDFSIGGTVYAEDLVTPVAGATVAITDATGSTAQATTNPAGNFFILRSTWAPTFPIGSYTNDAGQPVVGVTITASNPQNPAEMLTHIGRDGSCASCHVGPARTPSSPGPVYVTTGAM